MPILSDVNLDEVLFSPDGRDLTLKFVDMDTGTEKTIIKCQSVYLFNFSNTFEKDDGVACYVGEVTCEKISNSVRDEWLSKRNFGFSNMDGSIYSPTDKDLYNFHVEGGEIVIDIACERVKKDGILISV